MRRNDIYSQIEASIFQEGNSEGNRVVASLWTMERRGTVCRVSMVTGAQSVRNGECSGEIQGTVRRTAIERKRPSVAEQDHSARDKNRAVQRISGSTKYMRIPTSLCVVATNFSITGRTGNGSFDAQKQEKFGYEVSVPATGKLSKGQCRANNTK